MPDKPLSRAAALKQAREACFITGVHSMFFVWTPCGYENEFGETSGTNTEFETFRLAQQRRALAVAEHALYLMGKWDAQIREDLADYMAASVDISIPAALRYAETRVDRRAMKPAAA